MPRLLQSALGVILCAMTASAADDLRWHFDSDETGASPAGWFVPPAVAAGGFAAEVVAGGAHEGERCVKLARREAGAGGFGNLMRSLPAEPYRGRRIRLTAAARVEGGGRVQLWLRVDRPGDQPGFFYNMSDRPITAASWSPGEIVGDVAEDAETINFGCMLIGDGPAYVDTVSLSVIGDSAQLVERPRALSAGGLQNVAALARLAGYVRHFHPSDEAARADWFALTQAGVRAVESAADAGELAAALQAWAHPIAPTVRVYAGSAPPPPLSDAIEGGVQERRVIYWRHRGFGGDAEPGSASIYSSRRQSSLIEEGNLPEGIPDPRRPLTVDLPGGVRAEIPLAVFANNDGTLPRGSGAEAMSKVGVAGSDASDRPARLANVILAWNVLQHFYPYFDLVATDWQAVLRESLTAAAVAKDGAEYCHVLESMAARLEDGHAGASCPQDAAWFGPALLWAWVENRLVITHVAPGALADVRPGDVVTTIDGRPAADALKAAEGRISGATPASRRYIAAARELRRGPRGSGMVLGIEPGPASERDAPFPLTVLRTVQLYELREPHPAKIAEIRPGYWYVDLDRIRDDDFRAALPSLNAASGIVFDLRGYPGNLSTIVLAHLTDKPVTCAQWHVPLVSRPDREGMTFQFSNWTVSPQAPRLTAKVAFLTGPGAISYAETYLGIVEHYRLAEIVGEPTAGTNGNVATVRLAGGYGMTFTGMRVLKHDGSRHHGVGIRPTVPCERTIAGVAAGRDEVLERALDVVSGE